MNVEIPEGLRNSNSPDQSGMVPMTRELTGADFGGKHINSNKRNTKKKQKQKKGKRQTKKPKHRYTTKRNKLNKKIKKFKRRTVKRHA